MYTFTSLFKIICLNKSKFSSWFALFKILRKTNFLNISALLTEIVTFWLKREVFSKYPQKCFNTTEKYSLAVCGSFWGEKQFLLIFVRYYWFDQKQLFKQIQIFLQDLPLFKHVGKNKHSKYFWVTFWDGDFLIKKRIFQWIFPKMLQNSRKA